MHTYTNYLTHSFSFSHSLSHPLCFSPSVDVTLDPDTVSPFLILSKDGKQVKDGPTRQNLPNHLKRFDPVSIVLGKPGLIFGRFYYEVQVMNKTEWAVGVAQESVTRKGTIVVSPEKGYWAISLMEDMYKALDNTPALLDLSQKPQKVGVFVDYEKGTVSFYDAENGSLMYSYRGVTFTEKLYPFLTPFPDKYGLNSAPLVITPVSYI